MPDALIQRGRVILPDEVVDTDVRIRGGRIAAIAPQLAPEAGEAVIDATGLHVAAGFVDIHNHGAAGFDFTLGWRRPEQNDFCLDDARYAAGLEAALAHHARHGCTSLVPTSLAAPLEDLRRAFAHIAAFASDPANPLRHMIAGINVEGSFIVDPAYAGAQNPEHFQAPDQGVFERLDAASGNRIRIVNLPPEHGAAGQHLTRLLSERGIVVAGGHSGAHAADFDRAVDAGLRLGVHFLNGPSFASSKPFHGGGAVEAMLRRDEVSLELIVDGYHVAPAYVRDVITRKGAERVLLISDSMFANGCEGLETFRLGGIPGRLSANGRYLEVANKENALFGSVLSMDHGFANVLTWLTSEAPGVWTRHHPAYPLDEALVLASRMASQQPARLLGIDGKENHSDAGVGSIAPGKRADLFLFKLEQEKDAWRIAPRQTYVRGEAAPAVR